MKILGIVGSPRAEGNTETLTRLALDEISKEDIETELITLAARAVLISSSKTMAPLRFHATL